MLPMMEEALVSLQYLPKGRKTWFCVRTNWHETPESLLKETTDPTTGRHSLFKLCSLSLKHHQVNYYILIQHCIFFKQFSTLMSYIVKQYYQKMCLNMSSCQPHVVPAKAFFS